LGTALKTHGPAVGTERPDAFPFGVTVRFMRYLDCLVIVIISFFHSSDFVRRHPAATPAVGFGLDHGEQK
jgi:hypothetical protein